MGGSNVLPEPEPEHEHEQVKPMARFTGSAASYLGIDGERVTADDQRVRNLFQGMGPDGEYQLRKMQDRQRKIPW